MSFKVRKNPKNFLKKIQFPIQESEISYLGSSKMTTAEVIVEECTKLQQLLLEKNEAYGDSAVNPVRIMSKASPEEQILVRIDDKLSRLARGSNAGEDVVSDLLGYLLMLKVCRRMNGTPD